MSEIAREDQEELVEPEVADAELNESEPLSDGVAPHYGVGPFSTREIALLGVWFVAFVISFFSVSTLQFASVWTSGLLWVLTIGLPTIAVFLIVLRRLSPEGIRRVGSLGIDQFASVAFSVSTLLWIQLLWDNVALATETGIWVRSWVAWALAVLMLGGVVLTVVAPVLPVIGEDFRHRREIVAHANARPLRPVVARPPAPPAPVAEVVVDEEISDEPVELLAGPEVDDASETAVVAPDVAGLVLTENADAESASLDLVEDTESGAEADVEPDAEAFWALVPEERDVVDDAGAVLFRIGPLAWALVIEDRGDTFVVLHEDGRSGTLHDVTNVTRG